MGDILFDDIDELQDYLCRNISEQCADGIIDNLKYILWKHILGDIYGAYTPKMYNRRYGLTDANKYVVEKREDGRSVFITVTSDEEPSDPIVDGCKFVSKEPGAFLKLLESGHMGIWRNGFARPAVSNAQKEADAIYGKST